MPSYLDFLFPPQCLLCQEDIVHAQGLCPQCWGQFHFMSGPVCQYCGMPMAHLNRDLFIGKEIVCGYCLVSKSFLDHVLVLTRYVDCSRQLILNLKHRDQLHIANFFARLSYIRFVNEIAQVDLIIPVPLHWQRRIWRKTNQSAEIARHLGKLSGKQIYPHYIRRVRRTPQMKGMTKEQRYQTVRSVFDIPVRYRQKIAGQHVLLIDDVMTSGATLNRLAQKCKHQGRAAKVSSLVMARVIL